MKEYDLNGSNWNNPLQHNEQGFWSHGILGLIDEGLGWLGFGNGNATSEAFGELTGYNAQQREFQQQEYLLEKEQEFARDYTGQMNAMKAAGINPNTAAAGIAGQGAAPTAPQVSSNTGGAAAGLSAASQAAGVIGQNVQAMSEVNRSNQMLAFEQNRMSAETAKLLEEAGLNHWNAMSVATLLPTMQANQKADFYLKLAQIDNTRAQYNNIVAEHERILEDIRLKTSEIGVNNANAENLAEQTRFQSAVNDFFAANRFLPDSPLDVSLRNSVIYGKQTNADAIGNAIETASNRSAEGNYTAEQNHAYEISNLRRQGENVADVCSNRVGSIPDLIGRVASHLDFHIGNVVSGLKNAISSNSASDVRSELTMVLNNCYKRLEEEPNNSNEIQSIIDDLNFALQLSNTELLDWAKRNGY